MYSFTELMVPSLCKSEAEFESKQLLKKSILRMFLKSKSYYFLLFSDFFCNPWFKLILHTISIAKKTKEDIPAVYVVFFY